MILKTQLFVLFSVAVYGKSINPNQSSGNEPLNLTPLVEKGQAAEARKLSAANPTLFAGLHSHAAFFNVDKLKKWNLFFWFFPAENATLESTPWIIWLQGGPGGSSLFGLFEEIGPLKIVNGTAQKMPITWGSDYSLLFIDNPAGTGFSYVEGNEFATNEDQVSEVKMFYEIGAALLSFLQQFLQVFPELRKAPLFIAGESYAGKYIPAFGHYIHHRNDSQPINLRGLAIGGGWIDPATLIHYSEFALQVGLIEPETAEVMKKYEDAARKACEEEDYDTCEKNDYLAFALLVRAADVNIYNYLKDIVDVDVNSFPDFVNRTDVRSALHVGHILYKGQSDDVFDNLAKDMYRSVKPWLEELLEHYGVMCYNGQLDLLVAYALSVNTYYSLNWSGAQAYRDADRWPVFRNHFDPRPVGYVKAAGNFMDVMVRGAGHMVAVDQPKRALQFMRMFVKKFTK